jgi:hypothetical protein
MRELLKRLDAVWHGARRWDDEPAERQGMVSMVEWPYEVWPRAEQYRIVDHGLEGCHRYGLEAKQGGRWVEMLCYDDGYDDYGKLHSARWVPLRTYCAWSITGLRKLKNTLLGEPQPKRVVE